MVVIFVSFGIQKFTLQSVQGIVQFISNSPFISWLSVFGLRGEAYFFGVAELLIAALLAAGAFSPILSAAGSLMGVATFAIFKDKDIVLLGVCAVLFLASLPRSAIRSRTA